MGFFRTRIIKGRKYTFYEERWRESSQMNCPVCENAAAEDITPDTFDGKSFRCPICAEYDIVGSVSLSPELSW